MLRLDEAVGLVEPGQSVGQALAGERRRQAPQLTASARIATASEPDEDPVEAPLREAHAQDREGERPDEDADHPGPPRRGEDEGRGEESGQEAKRPQARRAGDASQRDSMPAAQNRTRPAGRSP
jgi:hypothetical protein